MWTPKEWENWKGEKPASDNKKIAWNPEKERYVSWTYDEYESRAVVWQMYCNCVPYGEQEPILAGLGIKKCVINS